ncbi:hypothetical protein PR202_gb01032 [Eleusine coracana subsp. coracana]|uniref:Uncharacterized protein n=1 Tax=Eleusine coracana subsp. coracana TaxID=191504 RepID=A0AAV5DT40_ELECO|nr:hypothetical protein PR202_gb01032 [Eleusine coracana subsp. coracana]
MVLMVAMAFVIVGGAAAAEVAPPRRILMDMDMDIDDFLGMLYIIKQNRSEFELKEKPAASSDATRTAEIARYSTVTPATSKHPVRDCVPLVRFTHILIA